MRPGTTSDPGIFAGTKGLSTTSHSTKEGEHLAVGSDQMLKNQWNHMVMVVNREEGRLLHFLNGRLVAEDDFPEDELGIFTPMIGLLGDFLALINSMGGSTNFDSIPKL